MGFAKWGSFPGLCCDSLKCFYHSFDFPEVASQNFVTHQNPSQKQRHVNTVSSSVFLPFFVGGFFENVGGKIEVVRGIFLCSWKCFFFSSFFFLT